MDFNTTIDIIIKDLKETREIIDDLKNYPGVPQLQIELAKSKCKSAEEIIALLKTFQTLQEPMPRIIKEQPEMQKENVETLIELAEEEPGGLNESQGTEHSEIKIQGDLWHEEDMEMDQDKKLPFDQVEKGSSIASEIPGKNIISGGDKKPRDKKPETNIIADKFSYMKNTFNEQLGSMKNEDDISSMLNAKPVANLSDAIGLNDKFLFIREIFDGSRVSYDEAIAKLDMVENIPAAKAIIMSYTDEGEDNEVVKQLLDLVKRKLPSDG